ncbi:sugar ABC transporter substrate-binding protein [Neomicrococcus lactis]|uniref:sugar ABC transporter substrate-binding protein n=1 Tax=Neomicrococcus lactis TaxID=732241 RepID=UPI002300D4B0|nr:maltose ABC transporter substrate-binding protein [Neomicrococcus lactis]
MKVRSEAPNKSVTRRAFAIGSLGTAAAAALAACGGGSSSTSSSSASSAASSAASSSAAPTGAAATLTLWTDAERSPALKDIAAKFKADKGIEVKLVVKDFASVRDDFITQAPTGKGPDIIVGPHDWLGKLVQNGVVAPVQLGDKASLFNPVAVKAFTYEGQVYGLPYAVENIGLLRNKKIIPEAAKTFEEVVAAGKKAVSAGSAKYPFLVGLDPKQADPYHLYPLQTSLGSVVFETGSDGGYDATKLGLDTAGGAEFAKKLQEWGDKGAKVFNSNITANIAKEKFNKGESGYFLSGPWNVPDAVKGGVDLVVDPLPTAGDKPAQPFVGVNGFMISAKSTNALAANEFVVNYLSLAEAQDSLFKQGGRPPALLESFEKASADPIIKAFGEIGTSGLPMPAIPQMDAVWADWGATELKLIKGGVADPAAEWKKMVSNVQAKIKG